MISILPDMVTAVFGTGICDWPVFFGNNFEESAMKERSNAIMRMQNPIMTFTQYSNLSWLGCSVGVFTEDGVVGCGCVAGTILFLGRIRKKLDSVFYLKMRHKG